MISNCAKNIEFRYISFINELLKTIFRLSLVIFKEKKSNFTIDKNFEEMFEKNKILNVQDFNNLIFEINQELNSIDEFLSYGQNKKDFNGKDINLDILIESVNYCFSYLDNEINYNTLLDNLSNIFQNLIKKKKSQIITVLKKL